MISGNGRPKADDAIRNVVSRTRDLHTHSYLTLLSIGQAVALTFLFEEVFKGTEHSVFNPDLSFNSWLLIFETLTVIVMVWADYFQIIAAFTWIPSLLDAIIPFGLFTTEVFLSKTVMHPAHWFFSFAGFFLFAFLAYINTISQIKRRSENQKAIQILYKRFSFSVKFVAVNMVVCIIMAILLLFAPYLFKLNLTVIFTIVVLFATAFFIYKTVTAWQKFKLFIEDHLADE
jgi:hypothetical protein